MSKYASVLFDTDEYHRIGPFRFPIYHALLPGEAKGIERLARLQTKSTYRTIKLAQRIAKDKNLADIETPEDDGTVTTLSATQQTRRNVLSAPPPQALSMDFYALSAS
jgi:hypothetical protein